MEARRHAAERWADCVVRAIEAPEDPRTLEAWGHTVALSRSTLRARCRAAGVNAKKALDFTRMLRAVVCSESIQGLPDVLDVMHQRTLRRLVSEAGLLRDVPDSLNPEVYLQRQRFVANRSALDAIRRLLQARNIGRDDA